MSALDDLLANAARVTRELAASHREHADVEAMILKQRRDAWLASTSAVTARREEVAVATTDLSCDLINLDGEIRAFTAELAHLDRVLKYHHEGNHNAGD